MIPPVNTPKRPSGDTPFARFCQWVWDWITRRGRLVSVPGQIEFSYTEQGIIPRVISRAGSAGVATPNPFRISRVDDESALKFQVSSGYITTTSNEFTPDNLSAEHTVTVGQKKWLYLSITSTTASVISSATPPTWSVRSIPIGWVLANSTTDITIRQLVRDHIFVPCI